MWLDWLTASFYKKNTGGATIKQKIDFRTLPKLLTIEQVSEILQVHPNTLRNWDKAGKLMAIRVGPRRDRRYERETVERWYGKLPRPIERRAESTCVPPKKVPKEKSYILKPGLSWRHIELFLISKRFSVFVYSAVMFAVAIVVGQAAFFTHTYRLQAEEKKPQVFSYQIVPAYVDGWEGASQAQQIDLLSGSAADVFSSKNSAVFNNKPVSGTAGVVTGSLDLKGGGNRFIASGFSLPKDTPVGGIINTASIIVSFAAHSFTGNGDVVVLSYSLDGTNWTELASVPLNDTVSNATHGGFWSYPLDTAALTADAVNKLQIQVTYDAEPSAGESSAYLDGVALAMDVQEPESVIEQIEQSVDVAKEDFTPDEQPTFSVAVEEKKTLGLSTEKRTVKEVQVIDPTGKEVRSDVLDVATKKDGGDTIAEYAIDTTELNKPGLYHVEITIEQDGQTKTVSRDFTWGVLVMNTMKPVYQPGEKANIGMGVLDSGGNTLCDAGLVLTVTAPNKSVKTFSTKDGTIAISKECGPNTVTNVPDYNAEYTPSAAGDYQLQLVATTAAGDYTITDTMYVKDKVVFDITRLGPTRIWPSANYQMFIEVTPQADYTGTFQEFVPDSFSIVSVGQDGLVANTDETTKAISWIVDWHAGESYTLSYEMDPPNISPELFLLGPIKAGDYTEPRQWQIASDAACNAVSTGNWSTSGTWSGCNGGGVPDKNDTVTINSGVVVTVTSNASIAGITLAAASVANGITINSGITLTNSGSTTMNAPTAAVNSDLNVGAGTYTTTSISISGGSTLSYNSRLLVSTGTVTVSGNITCATTNTARQLITFSGSGTIDVDGNFASGTNACTLTGSTGTVKLSGSTAQVLGNYTTYYNVDISNSSGGVTEEGSTTIGGALTVTSGTFTIGAYTTQVTGTTGVTGTLDISSSTNTKTFVGAVTVNNGGSWTSTGNAAVTFRGGIANNGSFNSGTGTQTFNTNSQNLSGSNDMTFGGAAAISGAITLTNNNTGTVSIAGNLTGSVAGSNFATGANSTSSLAGTVMSTGIVTPSTSANTINYSGAGQAVKSPTTNNYYHLTLGGSGTPTLYGAVTTTGNFTTSGTVTPSLAGNTTVGGNLSIGSGTSLTVGAYTLAVTGTTGITGTLTISSTTGTKTFTDAVTINSGGTWTNSANEDITMRGGLYNNSSQSHTFGSGVYTFDTYDQPIGGNNAISIPSITVTGVSLTNSGTLTVTTALAGTGGLVNSATGTLNINFTGAMGITTLTASTSGNTVNYGYGGAQTVKATTYHHLTLSNSGNKTMTGVATVNGNLTMSGSATTTTDALATVGGNIALSDTSQLTLGTVALLTVTGDITVATGTTLTDNVSTTVNGGDITVTSTGSMTTSSGTPTLTMGATGAISGNGNITVYNLATSGTGTTTYSASGTNTINNNVTIGANTTLTFTASATVNGGANGGITATGNLNVNSGTLTIGNGSDEDLAVGASSTVSLASTVNIKDDLNINGGTVTATSTFVLGGDVDVNTGILNINNGADIDFTGAFCSSVGATVNFNGGTTDGVTANSSHFRFEGGTINLNGGTHRPGSNSILEIARSITSQCVNDDGETLGAVTFNMTGGDMWARSINIYNNGTLTTTTVNGGTLHQGYGGTSSTQTYYDINTNAHQFYNFTQEDDGGINSLTTQTLKAVGAFTIASGKIFTTNNKSMQVDGGWANGGTYTGGTSAVTLRGGNVSGANDTSFYDLTIGDGTTTNTITVNGSDDPTATNSLTVDTGDTLSIGSSRTVTHSGGTMTLNGTISGTGTMIFTSTSSGPGSTGTLSAPVRFDATGGNVTTSTFDARTYGGNVEAYSNVAAVRSVAMASGTQTLSGNLTVTTGASQSSALTLDASANPTVGITGSVAFSKSGSATPVITSGTGTWTVSGSVDMSNGTYTATSGNTLVMSGSGTFTGNSNTFYHVTLSGAITLAKETFTIAGNLNMAGGTITHGDSVIEMTGTANTIVGAGQTLHNLTIDPSSAGAITLQTSDLSVDGTLSVASSDALTIGAGRILTNAVGSSITLNGTINGPGTLLYLSSTVFPATGTIANNLVVRFDATSNNQTMGARTYEYVVIDNSGSTNGRTVSMGGGDHTINDNLTIQSSGSGTVTLDGDSLFPRVVVTGNVGFAAGGATKTMTLGGLSWTVGGNFDMTNGVLNAVNDSDLTMNGKNTTFTSNGYSVYTLRLSNEITLASATHTIAGWLVMTGGTITPGTSTVVMSGTNGGIVGGGQTLYNLTVDPATTGTSSLTTSDLTVSNTLSIAANDTLTLDTGRTLTHTGSTLTLNGILEGPGRLVYRSGTAFPATGTLQGGVIVRFDTINNNHTIPTRSDYQALEINNSGSSNGRTVTMGTGTNRLANGLTVLSSGTGSVELDAATNNPTVTIGGDVSFTAGGGTKTILTGSNTWIVSGNVNLTNGTFTEPVGHTLKMNGNSKSITAAGTTLQNFVVSGGSVSSVDALVVSGTFTVDEGGKSPAAFTQGANVDLSIAGNFTLNSFATFTKASGTGKVIFNGDLEYWDLTSPKQNIGDVQVGTSPDSIELKEDMAADSILIKSADSLITHGFDLDVAGDITIDGGTLDATDDTAGDNTLINLEGSFLCLAGSEFKQDESTVTFDATTGTVDLETVEKCDLYNLVVDAGGGDTVVEVEDPLTVLNDVTLVNKGTLDAKTGENNAIVVHGSWDNNGGTFLSRSGTVSFVSGATGKTINNDSSSFYNVVFDGVGGEWTVSTNTMLVSNDMTVTHGTVTGSQGITVSGGDLICGATCGTINMTGGTTSLYGTGNFGTTSLSTTWIFSGLRFGDTTSDTTTTQGTGTITVSGVMTIAASQTFNAGAKTYTLSGTGTPFVISGTLAGDTSTFKYTGNGATNITASANYNNLEILPGGNSVTHTLASGTFTAAGNLTLGNGAYTSTTVTSGTNNPTINVNGNLVVCASPCTNQMTYTKGTGTTTLSPGGTKTWEDNNTTKQDAGPVVMASGSSTPKIQLATGVRATGVSVAASHELDLNSKDLYITGGISGTSLDAASGGSVTCTGCTAGTVTIAAANAFAGSGGSLTFFNLSFSAGATLFGNFSVMNTLSLHKDINAGTTTATMIGTSGTVYGGSATLYNLTIDPSSTGTVTLSGDDMTVSHTLSVASSDTFSIGASRVATVGSSGSLTLNGTISGAGTLKYQSGSTFPTTGTVTADVQFDAVATNQSMGVRTYGGDVEIYNTSTNNRTVTGDGNGIVISGELRFVCSGCSSTTRITLELNTKDSGITIVGKVTLVSGSAIQADDLNALSIGGDFVQNGKFYHNNGTVIFNGTSQQALSGTMTVLYNFNNVTITNSSGTDPDTDPSVIFQSAVEVEGTFTATTANTKLRFTAGQSYYFTNIDFNGQATGTRVFLRSSSSGTPWNLVSLGTQSVSFVNVQDSNACSGDTIDASDGTNYNAGDNTCWNFGGLISGIVYSDDGTTPYDCSADNLTINISVNGDTAQATTCTMADGSFSFEGLSPGVAGEPVAVYINGSETPQGTTISLIDGSGDSISGADIYQNRVIVKNANGWLGSGYDYRQPITITENAGADQTDYTVFYQFDHAALVTAGKSLSSGDDIRIVNNAGVQIDRVLDYGSSWNSATTTIAFKVASLPANGSRTYYMYYGNASAGSPTGYADGAGVYYFWDDFTDGNANGWTAGTGTWAVASDSGNNVYSGTGNGSDAQTNVSYAADSLTSYVLTHTYRVNGGSGSFFPYFGTVLRYEDSTHLVRLDQYTSSGTSYIRLIKWDGAPAGCSSSTITAPGTSQHTMEVIVDGSTYAVNVDGANIMNSVSCTPGTIDAGNKGAFANQSANVYFDDYSVRKYTASEPSLAGGDEESQPTTAAQITNADLAAADNGGSGIHYAVSGSDTTFDSGYGLYVWPGSTYDPGGTFTTQGAGGDLVLANAATAYVDTDTSAVSDDISIASGATLSLDASRSLVLAVGKTLTLDGAIAGSGMFIYRSSSTFPSTGTVTATLRFDATSNNETASARTYGGPVEFYNSGGSSRTIVVASGTLAFSSTATLTNAGGGSVTLDLNTNDPTTTCNGAVTIGSGATLQANSANGVDLKANYTNSGTFTHNNGTVTVSGTAQQTLSGSMTGGSAFGNMTVTNASVANPDVIFGAAADVVGTFVATTANTQLQFLAGANYGLENITLNGQSENSRVFLRSSSIGTQWNLISLGTQLVSNTNVRDSYACGGDTIDASDGTNFDATNNNCWLINTFSFSISDTNIGFGDLSAVGARWATGNGSGAGSHPAVGSGAHTLNIASNADSGYVLTYYGSTLTSPDDSITAATISGDSDGTPGAKEFALAASSTSATIPSAYQYASDNYRFVPTTVTILASNTSSIVNDIIYAYYIANISGTTKPGSFSANITYIVTPTF